MDNSGNDPDQITGMLRAWSSGEAGAVDALLPMVYDELHRQAARYLRKERAGHTLQPTALINEAYLKLIRQRDVNWQSRAHFFAFAANAMRHVLVDHARAKYSEKRGGDNIKLSLEDTMPIAVKENSVDLIALDEALCRLGKFDEQQARVVELRYFGGLDLEETAAALHISRATVARDWEAARAWLYHELTK